MASKAILVIGGGFAGITSALEAAEMGHEVYLVEKAPFLGGRVAQLYKYFPKLCPPSCGLEIQFQRLKKAKDRIKIFTQAEVAAVSGTKGAYTATVKIKARHVGLSGSNLEDVAGKLTGEVSDDFNFGLSKRGPLYMDVPFAFPHRYVVDKAAAAPEDLKTLEATDLVDMAEQDKEIQLDIGAIVVATGWQPYDMRKLENLGAGQVPNVISNMQMERLASPNGPTCGKIQRPTDGQAPKSVAFVQCAGSRDENHLGYCSYICCMASLKQARYVREQYPDTRVTVYYIDLRTPGRYDNFKNMAMADPLVKAVKGKVAEIQQLGDKVLVTAEDATTGIKAQDAFDLVVLATGMQPSIGNGSPLPFQLPTDEEGFVIGGADQGIFAAGCAKLPLDVMKTAQSATSAAMKAIQTVLGR